MNQITSNTITAIRFPLIVAVVLLHTYIIDRPIGGTVFVPAGEYPALDLFEHLYRGELGNVAVPLYFFISGFLFFHGIEKFDWWHLRRKLCRRVHSLVIPYFFWNVVFMLFVGVVHATAPSLLTYKRSFADMTLPQVANCFWNLSQGLIPLWFIRDLVIMSLFSPLIYIALHHKYHIWVISALFLFYLSGCFHYAPGLGMRCSFPYMLGACFSINGKDLVTELRKKLLTVTVVSLTAILIDTILWSQHISVFYINRIGQIFGALALFTWFSTAVENHLLKPNAFYSKGSFFVFVFHMFIIYIPAKLWVYLVPVNGWTAALALILIPLMVSYACLGIYWLLQKAFPKITSMAMGERG